MCLTVQRIILRTSLVMHIIISSETCKVCFHLQAAVYFVYENSQQICTIYVICMCIPLYIIYDYRMHSIIQIFIIPSIIIHAKAKSIVHIRTPCVVQGQKCLNLMNIVIGTKCSLTKTAC